MKKNPKFSGEISRAFLNFEILSQLLNFEILRRNLQSFLKSDFSKMHFSLLSLGNFNFVFENEISPDSFNFGQFATFRRDSFQISKFSGEISPSF